MRRSQRPALLLLLLLLLLLPWPVVRAADLGDNDNWCFSETGHCISPLFRTFWAQRGGLARFGLPITAELWEDQRIVQYFERNRFEFHPEHAPAHQVLLGRLGEERLRASGIDWSRRSYGRPLSGCRFFPETGHNLCGGFRSYWETNGGLALFGYPITEAMIETSETDGRSYTVQYFERNRFEYHPENPAAHRVLLGLLGSWRAGWLLEPASERHAHAVRAVISGPTGVQSPLSPVTLSISTPDYRGTAQLYVFDASGRRELAQPVDLSGGSATVTLATGGALGAHAAVLVIDGRVAGITGSAYLLDAHTHVATGIPRYDDLVPRVRDMLAHDVSEYEIDGHHLRGYRSPDSYLIWLRDHVYQALGYRYFEPDMTSALDAFRRAQYADGSFDDYIANPPWGMVRGRVAVEADVEFLFVQGVYQAWQATGDDDWLRHQLEAMQRGLSYSTSHPMRWEPSLGLVKRPFTIDTWDFEYGGPTMSPDGKVAPRHWIDHDTKWSIMHGDNTGLAYGMLLIAQVEEHLGRLQQAAAWREQAGALMERLNNLSWNGSFFTHQVHLTSVGNVGVDESRQLSLSNAYALNREVLSYEQANAILSEYQLRYHNRGETFAEWYSIDPPFPPGSFGTKPGWGNQPGEYVNGGIMPLVGGELARGAFRWGHERYGFNILDRYYALITAQGGSYLWYYPDGSPGISGPETLNTDGWGSSAMLAGLIEGAAGVVDRSVLLKDVELSPRWSADPQVGRASVTVRYAASLGYLSYTWERVPKGLRLQVTGSPQQGRLRLLLPDDARGWVSVTVAGVPAAFQITNVGGSRYVELALPRSLEVVELTWR